MDTAASHIVEKAERGTLTAFIKKEMNNAEALVQRSPGILLVQEEVLEQVESSLSKLEDYSAQYTVLNTKIISFLATKKDGSEDEVTSEVEKTTEFSLKMKEWISNLTAMKKKIERKIQAGDSKTHLEIEKQRLAVEKTRLRTEQDEIERRKAKETAEKYRMNVSTEIKLETFDGNRLKWPEFFDCWNATIHCNDQLADVQKLKILKDHVVGPARDTIKNFLMRDANYADALAALKKNYDDPQAVIAAHYDGLIKLPAVTQESDISRVRSVFNSVDCHLKSLAAIGQRIDPDFLLPVLQSKIPEGILSDLHLAKGRDEKFTVDSFLKMLDDYLHAKEIASREAAKPLPQKEADTRQDGATGGYGWKKKEADTRQDGATGGYGWKKKKDRQNPPTNPTGQTLALQEKKRLSGDQRECVFCGRNNHESEACKTYPDCDSRREAVIGRCFRCFRDNHFIWDCRVRKPCSHCHSYRHNSALCPEKYPAKKEPSPPTKKPDNKKGNLNTDKGSGESSKKNDHAHAMKAVNMLTKNEDAYYPTAVAKVKVPGSKRSINMRLGFDNFSNNSYVTVKQAERLNLPMCESKKEAIGVFTFGGDGGEDGAKDMDSWPAEIEVLCNDGSSVIVNVLIVKTILGGKIQRKPMDFGSSTDFVNSLDLADPLPETVQEVDVDVLIGLNAIGQFLLSEILGLTKQMQLQRSKLGWILSGVSPADSTERSNGVSCLIKTHRQAENVTFTTLVNQSQEVLQMFETPDYQLKLPPNLEDLWELERIGIKDAPDLSEDDIAVSQVNESIEFSDGRYTVSFPKRECLSELSDNFALCLGRLRSLLKRLRPNPELLEQYNGIVDEQETQIMIEEVTDNTETGPIQHYLPHHPVITPEKFTTKVRMVFDGGAKSRKGVKSLNECLFRGTVMLKDLVGLSIRFRLKLIGIISDIKKAFLQLGLHIADRDLTRFLWLKDPTGPVEKKNLKIFRFCRVPFGVKPSPFLLAFTVDFHLKSAGTKVAEEIRNNIYVDNVICGANTVQEAHQIYSEGKKIMLDASLYLREWTSNSAEFLSEVDDCDKTKETVVKVLGLNWDTVSDQMSIGDLKFKPVSTKRGVLKAFASVFDPLGFFNPVTIAAKLFLQSLWELKLDWDEKLNETLLEEWNEIEKQLRQIPSFQFPRIVGQRNFEEDAEFDLVCFSDASAKVFDANVYLRVSTAETCTVDLIFSKARVSPAKKELSIPRMELIGMLIGTKILNFCEIQLHLTIKNKTLFSDSQCVLSWLKSTKQLSVFVHNRVSEINASDDISFRYIPTDQNPADLATRVCSWDDFQNSELWWHGPGWLTKPRSEWPEFDVPEITPELRRMIESEQKKTEIVFEAGLCAGEVSVEHRNFLNLNPAHFSFVKRLLRVTAWVLRFVSKLKKEKNVATGSITASEITRARLLWEKETQMKNFPDVFAALKNKKSNNLVKQLGLQLDENGILRCHGRLGNAELGQDAIFPILLPKKDPFTDLVVLSVHRLLFHSGVSHTVSQLRLRYWIPHVRTIVQGIILKCQTCRRAEGGPFKAPQMALWPRARVSQSSPFSYVGCDYLGPLNVKENDGSSSKVWVCLFTCFSVRAIHLELIRDLSAEHFLYGLRRFISVRGTPVQMTSDNGGQFTLTHSAMEKLWEQITCDEDVLSYISEKGFRWHFIPQLSPWMGGLYERLVGLVKRCLRKSMGRLTTLSFEQLRTLLSEVEAVLNSRPLVFVGSSFEERWTLCPADFLSLNPKQGFPGVQLNLDDPDYKDEPDGSAALLLNSWRKGQEYLDQFWMLWHQDYLLSLRERSQRELKGPRVHSVYSPHVGDIVLIKEDKMPRGAWKIARIETLKQSNDGMVRSAKLRLPNGKFLTRSVTFLYPIECPDRDSISEPSSTSDVGEGTDESGGQVTPVSEVRPSRPTRKAAEIGRQKVAGWINQLTGEDD